MTKDQMMDLTVFLVVMSEVGTDIAKLKATMKKVFDTALKVETAELARWIGVGNDINGSKGQDNR